MSDETYTPLWLATEIANVLGGIDLDPTAESSNRLAATQFYTKEDSCLDEDWVASSVYMNPPFSNSAPFIEKFLEEYSAKHFPRGIVLSLAGVLHNKKTSALLHSHSFYTCHWFGRLEFDRPTKSKSSNDRDIVLLAFGNEQFLSKFHLNFQRFGIITHSFPYYPCFAQ